MMWNKLLLTEFVIYLCCLVGLMLLVFEFYRFFFPLEIFLFFCNVCWCAHNLAVWKGQVDDQIGLLNWMSWRSNERKRLSESVSSLFFKSAADAAENNPWSVPAYLCYFKRHCRFGLTDVTGCNSAKSPLHWWIMTPWLGSSELLF